MNLSQTLIYSFVTCVFFVSTAHASVQSIKENKAEIEYSQINDHFSHTSTNPGYQVTNAPNVNWQPAINLDKATGAPRINLSNSTGDISGTSGISGSIASYVGGQNNGVNSAVKEYVQREIAKVKPTVTVSVPSTQGRWVCSANGSLSGSSCKKGSTYNGANYGCKCY